MPGTHQNPQTQQPQDGHTFQTGKVEVFDNNRWGGVCHSQFATDESKDNFAKATCRTLGQLGGEWMEPRTVPVGSVAQKSMTCHAGAGEFLDTCDSVQWFGAWFQKTNGKGSPVDANNNEQPMWALKQAAPQNNLYRALKDCLMMPGCFSIGQVVNDNSAALSYKSRRNRNALKDQGTPAGFKANIDALRYSSGYCDVNNASFDGFNNRSMCSGGKWQNLAYVWTLIIKDTENKQWHFSPRVDFGRGGAVFIDNTTLKVKSEIDMWQPNDKAPGALDFSHKMEGETKIEIQGSEKCCDGTQRLWYARNDSATPPAIDGKSMSKNGWTMATPESIAKDIKDANTSKDVYYFFVDKANKQSADDSFSKQMPYFAVEQVTKVQNVGTGAAATHSEAAAGGKHLQTWEMINHDDRNGVTATRSGYFLDGSPVTTSFFEGGAEDDEHFTQEDSKGVWRSTKEKTNYSCITCEMGTGEQRVMKGPQSFWGAAKACRHIGGDLPKKLSAQDKSNLSYTNKGCTGDIQSPQFLQSENFTRQSSLTCKHAVVQCIGNHTCGTCVSKPQGFGRLLDTDGKVVVSYLPNEGFLTSENFVVSSSPGKEMGRWDSLNTSKKDVGYQVQFRPDESLSYAGPESTFTLTWHQEQTKPTQKVIDFNNSDLSKNTAGYSGAQNVPGRGSYWIWFKQDYFQKGACKAMPTTAAGIESFRCIFFAKMFLPPLTGVKHSFTWVYMVTQDTNEQIKSGQLVSDSMQCKDPLTCSNSAAVTGVNIKAADYAECGFTNPPKKEKETPLNPKVLKSGTDVYIRCQWDPVSLNYGAIQKWDQGMDGVTPTSDMMKKIRNEGYPNNTHIKNYPFSCLAGQGRVEKGATAQEDKTDLEKAGWMQMEFVCDQQFNGTGTYHELAMTFTLNKSMARRRRLEKGDDKGDEGTFAYNMRSGKCVTNEDGSGCPADDTDTPYDKKGEFALWFSLLALFALI